jgi:hypothetical protein
MDPNVKHCLEAHFQLDFNTLMCGDAGRFPEAEATCKHGCELTSTGRFLILEGASLASVEVRKAMNHAKRCQAVSRMKRSGNLHGLGGWRSKRMSSEVAFVKNPSTDVPQPPQIE